MATLQALKERWDGTPACFLRTDEQDEQVPESPKIKIFIKEGGKLAISVSPFSHRLTLDMLLDDHWKLKYPISLCTEDIIKALEPLNPELCHARFEWHDRQKQDILNTIHAICRACGIEINGKLEWKE